MRIKLIVTIACVSLLAACSHPVENFAKPLPTLCEGDIIFRLGLSRESHIVNIADRRSSYSHVGIIVDNGGTKMVVHAVPDERPYGGVDSVRIDSISQFWRSDRALRGIIVRLNSPDSIRQRAAKQALDYYQRETLFDGDFSLEDTTSLYCTELIERAYTQQGISLSQGRKHRYPAFREAIILPSDILDNQLLDEVYYFEW